MSHEFQYTSAEQTLQPGLKGFGPVVASRGIPATLQEKLVVLSAYRHLYAGQDPKSKLNPVIHSHLIILASGKTYHVLSRVTDAGFDYSHRSNKFAHHVALEAAERTSAGPAAALAAPGFMDTSFSGSPLWLDQGRRLPPGEIKPAICRAWHAVTGDAGWGGVLAESALQDNSPTVIVVYRAGVNVLPLVAEALALLPNERRWQVTFSTFYQKLPPGVHCQWRFMPVEDAETKVAVKALNVRVIDLTRKLDKPIPSPWVEAARTGHRPVTSPKGGNKNAPLQLATDKTTAARATGPAANLGGLELAPLANNDLINWDALPVATALPVAIPERTTGRGWWIGGIAAGVVVLIAAAYVAIHALRESSETIVAAPIQPVSRPVTSVPPATPPPNAAPSKAVPAPTTVAKVESPPPKDNSPAPAVTTPIVVAPQTPPVEKTTETKPAPVGDNPPSAPMTASTTVDPFVPLRQVRAQSLGLSLPPAPVAGGVAAPGDSAAWTDLIELPEVDGAKLELQLHAPSGVNVRFGLEASSPAASERSWLVLRLTGSPAGDDELGRLQLKDSRLQFAWSQVTSGMQSQLLGRCWLTMTYGSLREKVRLQAPTPLAERTIAWNSAEFDLAKSQPWNAQQRLVLDLVGQRLPGDAPDERSIVIGPGERRALVVRLTPDGSVTIEAAIRAASRAPCELSIDYTLLCTVVHGEGVKTVERHLFKPEALRAAETLAERSVEDLTSADSAELNIWRQRLSQYALTRKWLNSAASADIQIRGRLFRR
ncbi:MAG: hypothetical protein JNM18_08900, partial [Planctomycetaceae bacterium]|nr:hypothetical protein [Planctomycetaceae bacterium]